MEKCICSSCKNLKAVVSDEGGIEEYECRFGFPSDRCENCNEEDCEEICNQYLSDEEIDGIVVVKCCCCEKELTKSAQDPEDGEVYCMECYLKK